MSRRSLDRNLLIVWRIGNRKWRSKTLSNLEEGQPESGCTYD
jgi:hypothetical protein